MGRRAFGHLHLRGDEIVELLGSELRQRLSVDEERRRALQIDRLHVRDILVQHSDDRRCLRVVAGLVHVQPGLRREAPRGFKIRRSMDRRSWLFEQQPLQDRLEFALHTGYFQDSNRLIRALMQRRVMNHQPRLIGQRCHDLLHDRIEGAAGFAGRIEELDDRHRRIVWTDHWGMCTDQVALLLRCGRSRYRGIIGCRPGEGCEGYGHGFRILSSPVRTRMPGP